MMTLEQLKRIFPLNKNSLEDFVDPLNKTFDIWDISTPRRQAAFLGQVGHETLQLTRMRENLNYSTEGLIATWPKLFDNDKATEYARQQEKIANYVYANRYGNGDEASGDGWAFRGGGGLMLTFKGNYIPCGEAIGIDLEHHPELIEDPEIAMQASGWFFSTRGLNGLADTWRLEALTEKINSAKLDLKNRIYFSNHALDVLS